MESFEAWLEELPIQTLTYELKDEILQRLTIKIEESYGQGYSDAKEDILNLIENKI
jgi:hypothetical protein